MDCSIPGFPVLHYLLGFAQTRPLNRWCHSATPASVAPFSSYPQYFPTSGSFLVSWLFPSGGQSVGASALVSDLPVNIQDWFPLGLIGLISLLYKGHLRVFSCTIGWNRQFFWCSTYFVIQLSHLYMTTGKIIALIIWTFVGKLMSLLDS